MYAGNLSVFYGLLVGIYIYIYIVVYTTALAAWIRILVHNISVYAELESNDKVCGREHATASALITSCSSVHHCTLLY